MSIDVDEWTPAAGCKQCNQAAKIFNQHVTIAAHSHALARNRIQQLDAENKSLRDALSHMLTDLSERAEIDSMGRKVLGVGSGVLAKARRALKLTGKDE